MGLYGGRIIVVGLLRSIGYWLSSPVYSILAEVSEFIRFALLVNPRPLLIHVREHFLYPQLT